MNERFEIDQQSTLFDQILIEPQDHLEVKKQIWMDIFLRCPEFSNNLLSIFEQTGEYGLQIFDSMIFPKSTSETLIKQINLLVEKHRQGTSRSVKDGLDLEAEITRLMHEIGVPSHIKGYKYLRTAIMMTIKDTNIINAVTKELYPSVAKAYRTTSSRVERAIRHAIEVAWDKGNWNVLASFMGCKLSERSKPTNSEFIAMVADTLTMRYKDIAETLAPVSV